MEFCCMTKNHAKLSGSGGGGWGAEEGNNENETRRRGKAKEETGMNLNRMACTRRCGRDKGERAIDIL